MRMDVVSLVYPMGDGESLILAGNIGLVFFRVSSLAPGYRLSIIRVGTASLPLGMDGLLDNASFAQFRGPLLALRAWRVANLTEP